MPSLGRLSISSEVFPAQIGANSRLNHARTGESVSWSYSCSCNSVVVEDCVSSQREADKRVAVERMRQEGARITTCESVLFELLGEAGTETFRQIAKLVKEAGR